MNLTHDSELALRLAVDLVNSRDEVTGEDRLPDVASLEAFLRDHSISGVRHVSPRDLATVRALRPRLRSVFTAALEPAIEAVNALLAQAQALPQLTNHDRTAWHFHYTPRTAALAERLAADAAMALGLVLRDEGVSRLRVCAAPDCENVLVDLSRNRSRRYCDVGNCGNRLHVAAYRARRSAPAG